MFEKRVLLQPAEHGGLRLSDTTDWRFAAGEVLVPLVVTELADAAREYPLIFLKGNPLFFALTGIERGVNAYVADGRWLAAYIPARLRAYPLAMVPVPEKPGEFAVFFDVDAPQFMVPGGRRLFEGGKPSAFLKDRMALLKNIRQAEPPTAASVQAVRDAGLLVERNIRIRRRGGQDRHLAGLQVVDEKRLNELPHGEFVKLRERGALPLIYAHLLSMANLRGGPLAGRYPQLAPPDRKAIDEILKSETVRFFN
jgi:hypothetical protein